MPVTPMEPVSVAGVLATDLVGLFLVLAAAFGAVIGAMALVTGWQMLRRRRLARRRRVVIPRVGVTELAVEDARG